ncbi:MAG: DUF1801 domain-containing protein [Myxococcota bacterium]
MSIKAFINALPDERRGPYTKLWNAIKKAAPKGFKAQMQYGMPSLVVPHARFPDGYHCTPSEPLPFIGLSNTKGHVGLHHFGLYVSDELKVWFEEAYAERVPTKLKMGKSCVRFTNPAKIPTDLIAELCGRMSVDEWVEVYVASRP